MMAAATTGGGQCPQHDLRKRIWTDHDPPVDQGACLHVGNIDNTRWVLSMPAMRDSATPEGHFPDGPCPNARVTASGSPAMTRNSVRIGPVGVRRWLSYWRIAS